MKTIKPKPKPKTAKKPPVPTPAQRQANSRANRVAAGSKRTSMILSAQGVEDLASVRAILTDRGIKATDANAVQAALRFFVEKV